MTISAKVLQELSDLVLSRTQELFQKLISSDTELCLQPHKGVISATDFFIPYKILDDRRCECKVEKSHLSTDKCTFGRLVNSYKTQIVSGGVIFNTACINFKVSIEHVLKAEDFQSEIDLLASSAIVCFIDTSKCLETKTGLYHNPFKLDISVASHINEIDLESGHAEIYVFLYCGTPLGECYVNPI